MAEARKSTHERTLRGVHSCHLYFTGALSHILVACFVCVFLLFVVCGFCLLSCVLWVFFVWPPSLMDNIWTVCGSMLSFDTPKEEKCKMLHNSFN